MNKFRLVTLIAISIITLLGFISKLYTGHGAKWLNDSFSGFLYEIFWCLIISYFLAKTKPWKIALSVFTITCILEFLQLWHPMFLEMIRSTFIGRTILGTSFVLSDFIYYIFGSLAGWIIIKKIKRSTSS